MLVLAGLLVIVHALLTAAIWLVPSGQDAPFDPAHSWLLGDTRTAAVTVALLAAAGFAAAGLGLVLDASWWPALAVVAGAAGTVLMVVWFHPWLLLGLAISLAVLVAGVRDLTG